MFSFRDRFSCFSDGLECAEGVFPDLVKMSAEKGNAFGIQLINTTRSRLGVGYQARILKDFQMLWYGLTADGQGGGQLVDGHRSAGKLLEDGHTGGVAQGFEPAL